MKWPLRKRKRSLHRGTRSNLESEGGLHYSMLFRYLGCIAGWSHVSQKDNSITLSLHGASRLNPRSNSTPFKSPSSQLFVIRSPWSNYLFPCESPTSFTIASENREGYSRNSLNKISYKRLSQKLQASSSSNRVNVNSTGDPTGDKSMRQPKSSRRLDIDFLRNYDLRFSQTTTSNISEKDINADAIVAERESLLDRLHSILKRSFPAIDLQFNISDSQDFGDHDNLNDELKELNRFEFSLYFHIYELRSKFARRIIKDLKRRTQQRLRQISLLDESMDWIANGKLGNPTFQYAPPFTCPSRYAFASWQ